MKGRKHITFHPHDTPHHRHGPLAAYLFLFVAVLGFLSIHEPSTWLHIRSGEQIVTQGAIPDTDVFTYSVSGKSWTTGTWLADVIFYKLDKAFGPWGLIALKSVAAGLAGVCRRSVRVTRQAASTRLSPALWTSAMAWASSVDAASSSKTRTERRRRQRLRKVVTRQLRLAQ